MSRWLIVLIALLLPLQLAWAGVAAYCGDRHELAGTGSMHWHHPDGHAHAPLEATDEVDDVGGGEHEADHCHGHGTALPLRWSAPPAAAARQQADPLAPPRVSALSPPRPERPQWLAPA